MTDTAPATDPLLDHAAPPSGALEGIRVLEIGTLIAGPFAGRLLGDMGADVVKIEAPDRPDPLRTWGQAEEDGHHFFWTVHARNKRCITLDLRVPEGQKLFLDLVDHADVIIESFRPGTLEHWNLGWDVLSARNPRIVLARVSGYGQTGPYASRPGYASVAEGASGLRFLNGFPDQPPPRLAVSLGDSLGGMFAFQGVLAALLARDRTGRGQVVDAALSEACLAMLESTIPDYDRTGHIRQPSGTRLDKIAPSNLYKSADGRWVIIAANQDTLFARLCHAMDRPELIDDERFVDHVARGQNQDDIDKTVADWASNHDADELSALLTEAGVVSGPVNTVADVVRDPQFRARDMFVPHYDSRVRADILGPGIVPKMTGTPGTVKWAGQPEPGFDNRHVYTDLLGLDPSEIARLSDAGVI